MHSQPHTLLRPSRAAALATPGTHPDLIRDETMSMARSGDENSRAWKVAHAEGHREGFAAGKAAQAAHNNESEREKVAEEARQEGLQKGLDEGRAELARAAAQVREDVQRASTDRLSRLDSLLASAALESARLVSDAEDDVVALVHEAVCRVLGKDAVEPASLTALVRHLIEQHGQREQLSVHVHPDDLVAVSSDRATGEMQWSWVGDASVKGGGVVLRSPVGSLDARFELQMASFRDALLAARQNRKSASSASGSD